MKTSTRHKLAVGFSIIGVLVCFIGLASLPFLYYGTTHVEMPVQVQGQPAPTPSVDIKCEERRDEAAKEHLLDCVSIPLVLGIWSSYYQVDGRWALLGSIPFLTTEGTARFNQNVGPKILVTFQHQHGTVERVFSIDARWLEQSFAQGVI